MASQRGTGHLAAGVVSNLGEVRVPALTSQRAYTVSCYPALPLARLS